MLKMAVIGVGSMGRNHARVLMDIPDIQVMGIADKNIINARMVADKYGLPVYEDHNQLFDECSPDAVIIAVPTTLHKEIAMDAVKRGIHVLIEKPIASTTDEAEEIIKMADQNHVTVAVGHIERFNPAVIELKKRIDAGELGQIFMIHARRLSPYPRRISDVGVAKDLATHELDMMRYLTGEEVVHVSAEISKVMHSPHEDIVFGLLRFQNGILGILDVNWVTPTTVRELTITGEKGMFVVNYLSQELFFHENPASRQPLEGSVWDFTVDAGHMTRFQINKREPLRSELESFINAVKTGSKPLINGYDGLATLKLVYQITNNR
ncbi:MAG: gfo/Idh/MocA family oxidoreductase [Deltaproteobacteria bacterium HGW-Deltaproteobacteria-13]|jgi:predicted dehydrogenase|nr:MAG: gfo/Idh/MocA family oxidoreductase [Deltaproteobacteria bacterium HGW-Deltaproteobacteria-13]